MPIILAGVSHHRTPLEVRERFFFAPEAVPQWLDHLAGYNSLQERLILSTCNRVEVYSCADSFEDGVGAIRSFLAETRDIGADILGSHLYVLRDEEAMRHLFLVASSLDSMVVGEPQILGQVKEAYRLAQESGHAGKNLASLFSRAFQVAKRVRERTAIGESPVSVSSVAVDLAKKIFGALEGRTVLVIGAGEMAELAARHLSAQGAASILVANRTFARAQELAQSLGGRAVDYRNLTEELASADIVVASTGAPHAVLDRERVAAVLDRRKDRPMFLIDIAVPRDVEPQVNDLENVYVYDIDDLQAVVSANMKGREAEAEQARLIVEDELNAFLRRRKAEELSCTFAAIRVQAEAFREGELAKTLGRLPALDEKQRQALDAMTRAIVNKLLHHPFAHLRELSAGPVDEKTVELIRRLFGVRVEEPELPPPGKDDEA
ncbi:MAG: glutamyl-tRNA reductase [Candidatus Tectomicrobia bacterium]|uniref:Glutamyl-tRNA reductase n=1 Tax=Tectimicrobiota bacterium TaxID=2528274 RepID=A0A932I1C8_UNCTE|nr:glutamyl-tRNA reductase [Candidatus Tectomicrobia bacterium]